MEVLQVKNVKKFQEAPEWFPGCWREAPDQSQEVLEYFQCHLPEKMAPFFSLVQGEEDEKPKLFVLIDEEELASLGGHEAKERFYQENKDSLESFMQERSCSKYAMEQVFFAGKPRRPFRSVFK